jgi:sec-independent protein translocase protein TatA
MGFGELLLILLFVLLFFGAGKLGGLGAGLGKAARGFRDAVGGGRASPPEPRRDSPELPPKP